MKHAKHNRTPWVVLGGLAAVILCAVPVSAFCAKMFPIREEGDEQ